jgi:tRNA A-37 threonylcarbamoyl transferase component Bud32
MDPHRNPTPDPAALLHAALAESDTPRPWQPPSVEELAAAFPELSIEACIGQGGMAAVYRATQPRLGRQVALKVMRPDLAGQAQFTERFLREARVLAALSDPHVLTIHDFGQREAFCYLLTEYVDGANLRELMRMGRLSPTEVLRIVPQICAGLHFAHQHGVVHRDIKPENVLVDRAGQVKLADFGLAKLAGDPSATSLTRSGQVFGTPHYMAPEQWHDGGAVDHRADIYALGVVLYELLTGKLPVGTYPPASQHAGVPSGVDPIVQRSLQQEPAQRYQSAGEVQRDLEQQRQATVGSAGAVAAPTADNQPVRATWLLVGAAVWLALGATALGTLHVSVRRASSQRQAAQHIDAANEQLMHTVRSIVGSGQPWTGTMPVPVQPVPGARLDDAMLATVLVAGGAAVLVITMLLAAAAWRRTRYAGSSRLQHVLAGVLLALPVLGPLGGAIGWFANEVGGDSGIVRLLAMLCVGGGGYLLARALWRASAERPSGTPRPIGRATATAMLAAVLLAVAMCVLVTVAPRQPAWQPDSRLPITAERLRGQTRLEILDRLGPPRTITASRGGMVWGYRGLDGKDQGEAFAFVGDAVAITKGDVALVPEPRPASGAHLGMTLHELVRVLGEPESRFVGALEGSMLEFRNGASATVNEAGIVVALSR